MLIQKNIDQTADALRPAETGTSTFTTSRSVEEEAKSYPSCEKSGIGTSASKHILVIDDEPELRELVADNVIRAGFRVDTARNGEEGWEALCVTAYDLLITDHEMPKLTGLALIERLRAVSTQTPCILISGSLPMPVSTLNGIVHPGAVLRKPFSAYALIEKVYGLLSHGDLQNCNPARLHNPPVFGTLRRTLIG